MGNRPAQWVSVCQGATALLKSYCRSPRAGQNLVGRLPSRQVAQAGRLHGRCLRTPMGFTDNPQPIDDFGGSVVCDTRLVAAIHLTPARPWKRTWTCPACWVMASSSVLGRFGGQCHSDVSAP